MYSYCHKKNLPGTKITAIDVSADALDLARHNARTQNTTIDFLQMDFLNEKEWSRLKYFDLIISNPPYIPQNEMKTLAKNVTDFEPHLALFVPDNDPFLFYKKIATFSLTHLKKEANVFVEVHELFAREVADIFEKNNLSEVTIKKDIYGNERIIKARLINH